jgi:hypothetical protein
MAESKEFQLWLRRTLGQDAAREAEDARREATPTIMADEVKFEVRVGGHWTQVSESSLRA